MPPYVWRLTPGRQQAAVKNCLLVRQITDVIFCIGYLDKLWSFL